MNQMGLDLGTANTRICTKGGSILLRSSSVIAVTEKTHAIIATGSEAKTMIGRTPHTVLAARPVKHGMVESIELASLMLGDFFTRLGATSVFRRPSILLAIPCGTGENDKRALEDACFEAGASMVELVEKPIAAAFGAGIRVASPGSGMLVDIGAGTTGVSVISHGGIVVTGTSKRAGDSFTSAIIDYLATEQHLLVGELTAEALKHRIGSLAVKCSDRRLTVTGKSTKMGGAASAYVSSAMLREALVPSADIIVNTIKKALEETPAELSEDLTRNGLLLSGGSSMLHGLPEYLSNALGLRTTVSPHPLDDVALGLSRILTGGSEMRRYITSRAR